jgi:hypothetical protein
MSSAVNDEQLLALIADEGETEIGEYQLVRKIVFKKTAIEVQSIEVKRKK